MLLELKVSGFAVIDTLRVNFLRPGLNVLTGETGAGKSILIKSLGLLLGGKASTDVIRSGHEQAIIEGAFDLGSRPELKKELKELDLDSGDDGLVIRRIISATGKHRLYLNGNLTTLNVVEKITSQLIEITGQHEHHSLTKAAAQLDLLDNTSGISEPKSKYAEIFQKLKSLRDELSTLNQASHDREQRLDFLKYQINEIDSFKLNPGEEDQLQMKFERSRSKTKLTSFAQQSEDLLYNDEKCLYGVLTDVLQKGEALAVLEPRIKTAMGALKEASIFVQEASNELRDFLKNEILNEDEIENIEDRISDLRKLQKKYGQKAEDILAYRERASLEATKLEQLQETIDSYETQITTLEKQCAKLAQDLHSKRVIAAEKLSNGVNKELKDLNMKGVEFEISVIKTEHMTSTGSNEVTFMIRTSPKEPARPIAKIASGGELSRIMLALKQVAVNKNFPMTYLFDEVDAGISGPTAEKVGRKLKNIGRNHQVVCITHLPQVAAFADAHFLISKEVLKGQVRSEVTELTHKDRVQELGRMISGEKITASSLTHAREMIENSQGKH